MRVEIKQRKKMIIPFLLIGTVIMVGAAAGILFFEKYRADATKKISFVIGVAIFGYFIYTPVRKLIKNQPIIVFEDDSITLNTNKSLTIPKKDIQDVSVTYIDDTGYFLNVKTKSTIHETNISWLDKSPEEMKELIKGYRE